jgi:mevalonate kinase
MSVAQQSFEASAPGKLMLLGEHAVLHGHRCLVAAIDKRLTVTVTPRPDKLVAIDSVLGQVVVPMDRIEPRPPFAFILAALAAIPPPTGCTITVRSEFDADTGFGSSAAVTVATHVALARWRGEQPSVVLDRAISTVRKVQGAGSGADVAAGLIGGLLEYRAEPREVRRFDGDVPLVAVYSGAKDPTVRVVQQVRQARSRQQALFDGAFALMDGSCELAKSAIAAGDLRGLGEVFNFNQGLMEAIGVSNAHLAGILERLRQDPGIHGAKISGSGLGDCVVAVGELTQPDLPWPVYPIRIGSGASLRRVPA